MSLNTTMEQAQFVGLDFDDPALDLESIARGYGAHTAWLKDASSIEHELKIAMQKQGPSFLLIEREA